MRAFKIGNQMTLLCTTVVDELKRGLVDDDEEVREVTDRAFWENQASKETVALADQLLGLIHTFDPEYELKYNKFYIGLAKNGQANNFAWFRAKKSYLRLESYCPKSKEITDKLEQSGLNLMDYGVRDQAYRVRLQAGDIEKHSEKY